MTHENKGERGAILVDGNHVFVSVLQQIEIFLDLINDREIVSQIHFLPAFLKKFKEDTGRDPVETYRNSLKAGDYSDIAFSNILIDGLSVLPSNGGIGELDWFDAEMGTPEDVLAEVAKKHDRKRSKVTSNSNVTDHPSASQRPRHFELIEAGKYEFFLEDGKSVILPFAVKDDFIGEMYRHWQDTPIHAGLGLRQFYTDKSGAVRSNEKQVDTKFSIRAADIAHDPAYSHVTLVTNDGDHAPTVKRLLRGGKKVQVFSVTLDHFQAGELKKAAGDENCMTLAFAMRTINRHPDMVKAYEWKFIKSIEACPLFFPLANRMQRDIPYLAVAGVTSHQFIQYQVNEKLKAEFGHSDERIAEIRRYSRKPTSYLD